MPRIRRQSLPRNLWAHLLQRVDERNISIEQLRLLSDWLHAEPIAPNGRWFKRLEGMIVCGEGELVKTFLSEDQTPTGEEL